MIVRLFENDVEMYGAQTMASDGLLYFPFENDVEMYGAQTSPQVRLLTN